MVLGKFKVLWRLSMLLIEGGDVDEFLVKRRKLFVVGEEEMCFICFENLMEI